LPFLKPVAVVAPIMQKSSGPWGTRAFSSLDA
jgi:hypothetical protein